MPGNDVLAKGIVEKIGLGNSSIIHEKKDGTKVRFKNKISDHHTGIDFILNLLIDNDMGCLKNIKEIDATGHRIVHGGEELAIVQ